MPAPFPSRAEIEAAQQARLRQLVQAILPANPFYTRKFAGIPASAFDNLASFTAAVPFTTKAELVEDQQRHPPYGSNLTFPIHRYTRFHQTSGTSGTPLRWLDTPESWDTLVEAWVEVHRAAGLGAGDRVCFAFTFGPFLGFWTAFAAAERLGCLCLPAGGLSSSARLRMILDNRATALCCTPTYALHLAETAAEEGLDLASSAVRVILVAGEPGGSIPATRSLIEQLWPGARVFDHHGMTEVGPVTHQCPDRPGILHPIESAYFAEVIDPATARPTPHGTEGELVLTTLLRQGSPLLRYRTGDLVRVAPDSMCQCGRHTLAFEGGILGRSDDMVIVRGVNIYPSAVEAVLRACGGVAEYQAIITSHVDLNHLSLRIEPATDSPPAEVLTRRLEKALQDTFALRIPVSVVPAGNLPRFEMKARRWLHV